MGFEVEGGIKEIRCADGRWLFFHSGIYFKLQSNILNRNLKLHGIENWVAKKGVLYSTVVAIHINIL